MNEENKSMKKRIYILLSLLAIICWTAASASAQEDTQRLLKILEEDSDRFSNTFDKELDNSRINGTSAEGEITRYVKAYEDSTDRLKKQYDQGKFADVAAREVLTRAKSIEKFMRKYKSQMGSTTITDWNTVKNDLNRLAQAYKIKHKW